MNLHFIYETRNTPKSFSFLITFKAIAKLKPEYSDHFSCNKNSKKLAVLAHVLQTRQNLVIPRRCLVENGKEMDQEL